jgi:hypothetical protein
MSRHKRGMPYTILFILVLFSIMVCAQEQPKLSNLPRLAAGNLTLPIRDDFSGTRIFPDQTIWQDSNVYINSDFPLNPISIGVATFDGADKFGRPYRSLLKKSYAEADYLTSRPVNLASHNGVPYTPADSIYLSFYYQPQGFGDAPESQDSLVLEFKTGKTIADTIWKRIWAVEGTGVKPFKAVIVPVIDTAFLKDNFQFRFKNYTTYSGDLDHWSIDYVVLSDKRNNKDTVMAEITWVERTPSLLKNYQAVPWRHFIGNETALLNNTLKMRVRNNDITSYSTLYRLDVKDEKGNVTGYYPGPTVNTSSAITPNVNSYYSLSGIAFPSTIFPDNGKDSASFTIEKILEKSDPFPANNIWLEKQDFFNYYAYDDGTAEGGYGLNERGGKIAYQFTLAKADTLQAIQMYFNQMKTDVSGSTFKIMVWDNLTTNHVLYRGEDVTPIYENSVNGFHTYKLSSPILVSGTIYIGWEQNTIQVLNLGVDKNNIIPNELLHYFSPAANAWFNSIYPGAWMMRPILGKKLPLVLGLPEVKEFSKNTFSIFPNPASDKIFITSSDKPIDLSAIRIALFDALGRDVTYKKADNFIDISDLPDGFYILRLTDLRNSGATIHKIIISR